MTSSLVKRCVRIGDREVELRLEHLFWICLEEIANTQATTTSKLVASIGSARAASDLPSAVRTFVLDHFQMQIQRLEDMAGLPRGAAPSSAFGVALRPRWLN